MEQKVCLDSDVLIELLRGDKVTSAKLRDLEAKYELYTTLLNVHEVYYGSFLRGQRFVDAAQKLFSRLNIIEPTNHISIAAAMVRADLTKKGQMTDLVDIMIAIMAIENGCKLYTFNKNHFDRIPRLELI